ncbi:MAG: 3-methyl-2-oxobutanoate dehydrogenase subunit VorB [bacterium]|nr:3-methyl-2-oxobutanoate dehydrogenase subunit VorB [bacterium]
MKLLMKGNEAISEAALFAGAKNYFGYPITPQNEVAEYLSRRMPEVGATFLQLESEVAVGNALFGAAATGIRCFTTSSSPGISLMAESMSYTTAANLPIVYVNVCRAGPGLGGILPSQGDYFQMTRGAGHGDYNMIILAPSTVQEAVELMVLAFDLAEKYRNPVALLADGMIGQMMEPVDFDKLPKPVPMDNSDWAVGVSTGRAKRVIGTLFLDPNIGEEYHVKRRKKYAMINVMEQRSELYNLEQPRDIVLCAFGTIARVCKTVIDELKAEGIEVGLFRPISLWPFPSDELKRIGAQSKALLSVEMNNGQMIEDLRLIMQGTKPIHFYGRQGGIVPSPEEIIAEIKKLM